MSDKVKVITKEAGKPAQICEMEDSYKAIKDFLGGAIEYHDHPTLGVQFIVNRDAQSWDNTATVYVGGNQEVLGGNFIVAKHGEEGEIVSFDDKEAQDREIKEQDREGIKEQLVEEVKTYDQYFQGDCYAFKISDEFGKVVDEDKGYFGNRITDVLKNMKDNVNVEFEGLFGKMEKHSLAYGAMM